MTTRAAFLGHGSPMNTLEHNTYTEAWAAFGRSIERPKAVLAISAHWYLGVSAVTSMDHPRVIHDFGGFPRQLFEFDYPAAGNPALARRVAELVEPTHVALDDHSWGLDHGTWSVLAHVFPEADVPVVQLSIDATKPLAWHRDLGAKLAPLVDEDVLVLGSGNIVHNLGAIAWGQDGQGYDWAQRFDDDARELLLDRPEAIDQLAGHPLLAQAAPTPDHLLPVAYLAGLAAARGEALEVLVDGCTMGSLSMTSYATAA